MYDERNEAVLKTVVIEKWKNEYEPLKKHLCRKAAILTVEEYESQQLNHRETLMLASTRDGVEWAMKRDMAVIGDAMTGNSEELAAARLVIEGFEETDYEFFARQFKRHHGYPWHIMETKRCYLREQTLDDLDDLYRIYSGEGITDYMEPLYEKREDEAEYLRQYIELVYGFYELGLWLIIEKSTGKAIGRAGLSPETFEDGDQLELGYVIAREYQRQGYAREVCKAIMEYGEERYPELKINCLIEGENAPSIQLAKSLGFHYLETLERGGKNLDRYCI